MNWQSILEITIAVLISAERILAYTIKFLKGLPKQPKLSKEQKKQLKLTKKQLLEQNKTTN